jgi:predicted secreted protein
MTATACSITTHKTSTGVKPLVETVLTGKDNGRSIELSVGRSLTVELDESPTTGYIWVNKTVGDVLIIQNSDFSSKAALGIVGGNGLRTLRFVVSKRGEALLLLKQMREWEEESSAIRVFSVTINSEKL